MKQRLWSWRWRQSPLRRGVDVAEGWLLLAAIVLAAVGGLLAGVRAAGAVDDYLDRQRLQRQRTPAVLVQDPKRPPRVDGTNEVYNERMRARVRWSDEDGRSHRAVTRVPSHLRTGDTTSIWTDPTGRTPLPAPATNSQAALQSGFTGAAAGLGVVGVVAFGCRLAQRRIDRARERWWAAEWARVGPEWRRNDA
ncbi:hypothetical protein [Streptomyces boninensis]|uniref:Rv1733c family protein n=1 Tax=Streptomyces boninensis TaxID=2039455 RepID=UPI003B21CF09